MGATDLSAPCTMQFAGGFDVQVEQEVRIRRSKAFRLPHLPATSADAPSVRVAMDL